MNSNNFAALVMRQHLAGASVVRHFAHIPDELDWGHNDCYGMFDEDWRRSAETTMKLFGIDVRWVQDDRHDIVCVTTWSRAPGVVLSPIGDES